MLEAGSCLVWSVALVGTAHPYPINQWQDLSYTWMLEAGSCLVGTVALVGTAYSSPINQWQDLSYTWMLEAGSCLVWTVALVGVHQRAANVEDHNLSVVRFNLNYH
jgi:hypothetical protein